MNEIKCKGLSIEDRVICYFEMARDASLFSTSAEMLTGAIALMMLLQDADIDRKAVAQNLRNHAQRCGIETVSVLSTIDGIEGGVE